MQIRTRLTLQFLLIGGAIMIIASVAIYFSSARFREDDFYNRLRTKAISTATLLFSTNKADADRVLKNEKNAIGNFQNEKIIIINYNNDVVYSSDDKNEILIKNSTLEHIRLGFKVTYKQGSFDVIGTLFFTTYDRFVILAAANDIEGYLHLEKLEFILIVVCLVSLLLFYIAGWFYSGRALKPISDCGK